MRKRTRLLISTSVLVIVIGAISFAGKPQLSSAQDPPLQNAPFKSYQLRVFCDDPQTPSAIFWHDVKEDSMGVKVIDAGKLSGGTVSLDNALAGLPAEMSAAFRADVAKHDANAAAGKGRPLACLRDGKEKPPEDKKPKCEPPPPVNNNPPWLNKDSPCREWYRARISWSQTRASNMDLSFTIDICGEVIQYKYPGGGRPERMPPGSRSFDVCCDSWRNAADTGSPCDARLDIDCDGYLNDSDTWAEYSGRASEPDDFVTNSPLGGLPFGKDMYKFMPGSSGCKDCKWELVRVEYECKNVAAPFRSAGRPRMEFDATYKYKATWKCPTNGQTRETNDVATMYDLRCPDPANASWP